MAVRRKSNGADEMELIVILAAVGGLAYVLYKAIPSATQAVKDAVANTASAAAGLAPVASLSTDYGYAIPGTSFSVSDLIAAGWTNDQINTLLAQATQQYGTPAIAIPKTMSVDPQYYPFSSITGWLTGS